MDEIGIFQSTRHDSVRGRSPFYAGETSRSVICYMNGSHGPCNQRIYRKTQKGDIPWPGPERNTVDSRTFRIFVWVFRKRKIPDFLGWILMKLLLDQHFAALSASTTHPFSSIHYRWEKRCELPNNWLSKTMPSACLTLMLQEKQFKTMPSQNHEHRKLK